MLPEVELEKIKTAICEVCRRLNAKNYLASADGNVSYRVSDEMIFVTPSGVNKFDLRNEQIATIALDGRVLSGRPSSEREMHLAVYRQVPRARAVVHAHPPTAIAWTIARPDLRELPSDCMSELILAAGRIPIATYARPGTQAMGEVLRDLVVRHRLIILARHGALSWGEDMQEAYNGMERLEHAAVILKAAHELGGLTKLSEDELTALHALRTQLGDRTL